MVVVRGIGGLVLLILVVFIISVFVDSLDIEKAAVRLNRLSHTLSDEVGAPLMNALPIEVIGTETEHPEDTNDNVLPPVKACL